MLVKKLSSEMKIAFFKKNGLTWLKQGEPLSYVFDLQLSKSFMSGQPEDFAVNIGVFSPEVYKLSWGKEIPKNLKVSDCCLQGRLSDFFDTDNDWRTIINESDIKRVRDELINIFKLKIIPFFDKINSNEDLDILMEQQKQNVIQTELHEIYLGCIKYIIGKKVDALNILKKVEQNNTWGENAKGILKRMGIA